MTAPNVPKDPARVKEFVALVDELIKVTKRRDVIAKMSNRRWLTAGVWLDDPQLRHLGRIREALDARVEELAALVAARRVS